MSKVVFTDDSFVILATIPISSVWPYSQNAFASAQASEVLAGKGRRVRYVDQLRGNTAIPMPVERSEVERSD